MPLLTKIAFLSCFTKKNTEEIGTCNSFPADQRESEHIINSVVNVRKKLLLIGQLLSECKSVVKLLKTPSKCFDSKRILQNQPIFAKE